VEWRFESAGEIYPSSMRSEILALLREHGSPEGDFDSAELIYGELIGNAIRHARGKVVVRLDWTDEFPTLSVCDEERYDPPPICLPGDPWAESGRGLYIVKALAKGFEVKAAESSGSSACAILPVRRRPV
jgi:anti-sigma regulatory factor (Ser/Thr protein kinase)